MTPSFKITLENSTFESGLIHDVIEIDSFFIKYKWVMAMDKL